MATFIIHDTFNVTGRGHVLVGDITAGKISVGDIALIPKNEETIKVKILGVEMVDKIRERIAHVGLIISMQGKEMLNDLNLKGTEIQITNTNVC